jgi:hypothetical protein
MGREDTGSGVWVVTRLRTAMQRRNVLLTLLGLGATLSAGVFAYRRFAVTSDALRHRLTEDFTRHIGATEIASLSVKSSLDAMVSFFREVKYQSDASTPYGDALLFQYGVYDWGQGENFDFDITRQVVFEPPSPAEADDFIIQLSLTHRFAPQPFRLFEPVTKWSVDFGRLDDFSAFVQRSPAFPLVLRERPRTVDLYASAQ